jgi:hypothetical protein
VFSVQTQMYRASVIVIQTSEEHGISIQHHATCYENADGSHFVFHSRLDTCQTQP